MTMPFAICVRPAEVRGQSSQIWHFGIGGCTPVDENIVACMVATLRCHGCSITVALLAWLLCVEMQLRHYAHVRSRIAPSELVNPVGTRFFGCSSGQIVGFDRATGWLPEGANFRHIPKDSTIHTLAVDAKTWVFSREHTPEAVQPCFEEVHEVRPR